MYDVAIIGGGLSGSVCATALSRKGIRVALIEKDAAPRHKLCGEFLSGEVAVQLGALGVLEEIVGAGAVELRVSRITSLTGKAVNLKMPGRPLGITRLMLDSIVRAAAVDSGADLIEGAVTDIQVSGRNYTLSTSSDSVEAQVLIGAYGRRSTLDRKLERPFLASIHPYVAFKTHVEDVDTEDRVELFALDRGYCGMSRVEGDLTNVCWITHSDVLKSTGRSPLSYWENVLPSNPALREYLKERKPVRDFNSSSQLFFRAKEPVIKNILMIGDAAGMIAPLAGDGMAMAVDSAIHVSELVTQYLAGGLSRQKMNQEYTLERRRRYKTRMFVARALHGLLTREKVSNAAVHAASVMPGAAQGLVRLTRGRA